MTLRPNLFGRISLAMYQGATALITPILPWHLKRRKNNAKEHPKRWREKLGHARQPRPQGQLVWINAVGLGEVMALRGLIAALHAARPELHFLVTSTTLASAETFEKNLPPRTLHQFLPLDTPLYNRRFLDHWRPDLALWSEQDIWPGLVVADRPAPHPTSADQPAHGAQLFSAQTHGPDLVSGPLSEI